MGAQHCTNGAIYLPVVHKDEKQLTPASSLSSIPSYRVNPAHCACCRIKVTDFCTLATTTPAALQAWGGVAGELPVREGPGGVD